MSNVGREDTETGATDEERAEITFHVCDKISGKKWDETAYPNTARFHCRRRRQAGEDQNTLGPAKKKQISSETNTCEGASHVIFPLEKNCNPQTNQTVQQSDPATGSVTKC